MSEVLTWHSAQTEQEQTATVGMVIALVGWGMMFAAMFLVLGYLRVRSSAWPPPGAPELGLGLPTFNTLVLLASSGALWRGTTAIAHDDNEKLRHWLRWTLGLGLLFVAGQCWQWSELYGLGLRTGHPYGSTFFVLTVFHALHVAFGLALLMWMLKAAEARRFSNARYSPVRLGAMFWHFVDGVWVLMFVFLYVL